MLHKDIETILTPPGDRKSFKPETESYCDIECDRCGGMITVSFNPHSLRVIHPCEGCNNSPDVSAIISAYNRLCESKENCNNCQLGWDGICNNFVRPPTEVRINKPYNDSQPERVFITNPHLQRMPPLASIEGVLPEFQEFFDNVVESIIAFMENQDSSKLYILSDGAVRVDEFGALLKKNWGEHCIEFKDTPLYRRGFDVELNMSRFQEDIHRNLIGGFHVMTYTLAVKNDEFEEEGKVTECKKSTTELLFTYRAPGEFVLISKFSPFSGEDM